MHKYPNDALFFVLFPFVPPMHYIAYTTTHSLTHIFASTNPSINQSINPKQVRALPAVVVFPRGRIKECDDGLDRRCCGKYR